MSTLTKANMEARILIDSLESILAENMELKRSRYKECLSWLLINNDSGSSIRIIFDLKNDHLDEIGHHTVLDQDEYELCNRIDEVIDDGFETIFIHINFKKVG